MSPSDLSCVWPSSSTADVFITVSSEGEVGWTGKASARRLKLHWRRAATGPNGATADHEWVGVFNDSFSMEARSLRHSEALVSVDLRLAKSSSFVTSLSFPMPLIDLARNNSGFGGCLGGFWAAYARGIQVIKVYCLRAQPHWMFERRLLLGKVPLAKLLLPGTHESLSHAKFEGFFANSITNRWTYTQDEPLLEQLLLGIRFLDLKVDTSMDHVVQLVQAFIKKPDSVLKDNELKGPLGEIVRALRSFSSMSRDVVVVRLVFRCSPVSCHEAFGGHQHMDAVRLMLRTHLGHALMPYTAESSVGLTLDACLEANKTIVMAYEEWTANGTLIYQTPIKDAAKGATKENPKIVDDHFWPPINLSWNTTAGTADALYSSLNSTFANASSVSTGYFRGVTVALGYGRSDVLWDAVDPGINGIRQLAAKIDTDMRKWFDFDFWTTPNAIATDYFLSNAMVATAIEVNVRRAACVASVMMTSGVGESTATTTGAYVTTDLASANDVVALRGLVSRRGASEVKAMVDALAGAANLTV